MLNFQRLFESLPELYIICDLDFVIVGGSNAYFQATKTKREEVVGRHLFEVFPENPNDPNADGVRNLRASLEHVLKYRKPHTMAVQRYDIHRPESEGGGFEERHWTLVNSPFFDENGVMTHTIHRAEDVTVTIPTRTEHLPLEQIGDSRTSASTAISALSYVEEARRWLATDEKTNLASALSITDEEFVRPTEPLSTSISAARVLLVDDNADMCHYIQRLLSGTYTVETVVDGAAALSAIANHPPDLVLIDRMMPRSDGFELLRELRSNPQTQAIPVILLSAPGEEARLEGLTAGANDYLIKPFSARELFARVEATLKLSKLQQEAFQQEQALRSASETAQQTAEAAFRRIDQLLESMSEAFIALDHDWRIIYQNATAERINNKPRSQVLGKTLWEEWPAAIGSISDQQYRHALAEQVAVHFEQHYYEPPDHNVWLEVHAYPFEEGLGIFYRDITDRKQAEATILQREAQFRQLADAIPQQVWITDAQGKTQYVNQQWTDYTGLMIEQTQDIDCVAQTIHPDDFEATNELWNAALTTGTLYQAEVRLKHRSADTYRWFLSRAIAICDEQGQIVQWFGTNTDIEEFRRAQAAREQLFQRAQAAREAAENANQIKDEFLAILSHELRSPLNPILGWSKLLRHGQLSAAKTQQALQTIERNAQLQVQLIDDLLDISRILRGKLSLTVMPVDLNPVIWAALETVRLAAEAKAIQIQTTIASGIVNGDAGRLQQVVWNLLSNAVKFTPANGQVTVTLSSTETHAQIQVTDTGKGIKPEFLPHVFEHFRQEDGATTRKFGGLGLGLAIVRQIVQLHGGTVAVESQGEDKGATFTVQIPLASRINVSPVNEPPSGSTSNLNGIRILVVDDEADSREFVAFVLEQAGAIVTAVASGIDALQTFSQIDPDMIVSDIGMPEMDGYMLLRQIHGLSKSKEIPAIALTAYAGEFDRQQAIAAGFQRHLSKPVDPEEIVKVIRALCGSE